MTVTFTAADGREWQQTFSGAVDFYVFRRIACGLAKWRGVKGRTDHGDAFNVEDTPSIPAQ
jgi:hypothetical protein